MFYHEIPEVSAYKLGLVSKDELDATKEEWLAVNASRLPQLLDHYAKIHVETVCILYFALPSIWKICGNFVIFF